MPRVSVIIPAYNCARYIKETIESVRAQTFRDYEVIVIDDGSSDNTKDILLDYIASGAIVYHYQDNRGAAAARNAGIRRAQGEYIAFLDAGDIWLPEKLAAQIDFFNHSEAAMQYSYARFSDMRSKGVIKPVYAAVTFFDMLNAPPQVPVSTVMARRKCFDVAGFFDENLKIYEDHDLWLRISRHFEIAFIDQTLAFHRAGEEKTARNALAVHINSVVYFENMLKRYGLFMDKKPAQIELLRHSYRAGVIYLANSDGAAALRHLTKVLSPSTLFLEGNSGVEGLILYGKALVSCLAALVKAVM